MSVYGVYGNYLTVHGHFVRNVRGVSVYEVGYMYEYLQCVWAPLYCPCTDCVNVDIIGVSIFINAAFFF